MEEFSMSTMLLFWSFIAFLAIWSIVWKGFALWFSARNNHKIWFVFLLVVNAFGLLEIIYLVFVARVFHRVDVGGENETSKDSLDQEKPEEIKESKTEEGEGMGTDKSESISSSENESLKTNEGGEEDKEEDINNK